MTDAEIFENEIKCITRRNEGVCNGGTDCVKCDLLMDSQEILECYNRAIKNIDLTNRQEAEIIPRTEEYNDMLEQRNKVEEALEVMTMDVNSLTSERDALQEMVAEQKAEIDKWKSALKNGCEISKCINKGWVRDEAYREFAERFNDLLKEYAPYDTFHIYEIKDRIDIVEDVLTGGANNEEN